MEKCRLRHQGIAYFPNQMFAMKLEGCGESTATGANRRSPLPEPKQVRPSVCTACAGGGPSGVNKFERAMKHRTHGGRPNEADGNLIKRFQA
ncbi:MAG: hypothetical protein BJ554DRAFT_8333 [Olpidium bornovanus]|uniref:Uncharacterized protein n=1 Tax=Olpidium bornovanus TaxID=278681 RepID=A0A8H8DIJ3_9FUNG|nr:MAG: hypothetical protein BJ554DRAFT_8333 [Olpidium bornovanus]